MIDLLLMGTLSACSLLLLLFYRMRTVEHISPDGHYYTYFGSGYRVPAPYSMRPLVPKICKASTQRWGSVRTISVATLGPALYIYFRSCDLSYFGAVQAVAFSLALSTFVRLPARFPRLVDVTALCFMLLAVTASQVGLWQVALAFTCMGSLCSEKVPIFVAIMAGEPLALWALSLPFLAYLKFTQSEPANVEWLDKPYYTAARQIAQTLSQGFWPSFKKYAQPFGMLLLSLPFLGLKGWAALIMAIAPMVRSMDYGRLVHWAGPYMALVLVQTVPAPLLPVLLVIHYKLCEESAEC